LTGDASETSAWFAGFNCSHTAASSDMNDNHQVTFPVRDYDLDATLDCGQSFRWRKTGGVWRGIVAGRWVELQHTGGSIAARTAEPVDDWRWLEEYLQLQIDIAAVFATFPNDEPLRRAVDECRGLRLLKQDHWECLASFILSSTKQIVQIQQIVALLCERHGNAIPTPGGEAHAFSFPTPSQLAALSESDLRACKMGFRAPYLLATARKIAGGDLNLERLRTVPVEQAREQLIQLPGVGEKIANCVLLYSYGFQTAFPLDVWVIRALREFYFKRPKPTLARMKRFSAEYFGPHSGYAQQYLFHWIRTRQRKAASR
jgi:N-glycosylase/DNA lyase